MPRPIRTAFVSAERSCFDSVANAARTKELRAYLADAGVAFRQVLGCYAGAEETAFAVEVPTDAALATVQGWAEYFGQESILVVNEDRTAALWFTAGATTVTLRHRWARIPAADVAYHDNWTRIGADYYSAS